MTTATATSIIAGWRRVVVLARVAVGKRLMLLGFKLQFESFARDHALGLAPDFEAVVLGPLEPDNEDGGDPVRGVIPHVIPDLAGKRVWGRHCLFQFFENTQLRKKRFGFFVIGSSERFGWMVGKINKVHTTVNDKSDRKSKPKP